MGSMFEMSSELQLRAAKNKLAWVGISAQRARTRPSPDTGPFLAITHPDARLPQVCRIVDDVDHFARRI